jgi:hypothetical protein
MLRRILPALVILVPLLMGDVAPDTPVGSGCSCGGGGASDGE